MSDFGERLKRWRESRMLSQADALNILGIKSRTVLSQVENGSRKPGPKLIAALDREEQKNEHDVHLGGDSRVNEQPGGARGMLRDYRIRRGLSVDHLAEKSGVQASTIRNLEQGHKQGSEKVIELLAAALDITPEVLLRGSDMPRSMGVGMTFGGKPNIGVPAGMIPRTIPLLSWAQAGGDAAWDDIYEHEGIVAFDVKDPKAVAISIRGDSMEPRYPEGTVAIMYPSFEPRSGNLVIVRLANGHVMFKRFEAAGDKYTFISLNPQYPPVTVDVAEVEKIIPVGKTQSPELI